MEPRQERGLMIAARYRIKPNGRNWLVPSQTDSHKKYTVCADEQHCSCNCPDFEERGLPCKHIFAARYTIEREYSEDGTITEVETLTLQSTKKTYPQNWRAYNAAQTSEKAMFQSLLHDLCANITESQETRLGRPRLPLRDGIFCSVFKVYSTVSSRRFIVDLCEAHEKGFIGRVPHFNSVLNVFDSAETESILTSLIPQSAAPLASLEETFAIDSTAFSGCRFDRWFDCKWKQIEPKTSRAWVKAHVAVGCVTNIITAAQVLDKDSNDSPMLQPLMNKTAEKFQITNIVADKAYLSVSNLQAIADRGANGYIPFKSTNTKPKYPGAWNNAFHFFNLHREEFLAKYHQRSNAESAFSAIKRKFGDSVRAKNDQSMRCEALAKLLAHNLCCLIQAAEEFNIDPSFRCTKSPTLAQNLRVVGD